MKYALLNLVIVANWSLSAMAQDTRLNRIIDEKILRVGTTGDYKPFSYFNKDTDTFEGFDIEMAASLAKDLGVELQLVKTSWPTLMQDLQDNRFDIAMGGISITPERQETASFSEPYLKDGKTAITRCSQIGDFQSLVLIDRSEVRVIVNPGGTNERFVRNALAKANVIVFDDNTAIFKEIAEGRADVMITDTVEAHLQQRLNPKLCAIPSDSAFPVFEKAYLLPQDEEWKHRVDHWFRRVKESSIYSELLKKWIDEGYHGAPNG